MRAHATGVQCAAAPHTAHTTYDVPLIVVGSAFRGRTLRGDQAAAGWFDPAVRAAREAAVADEPVLKVICHKIAGDEFRHYKLFYTHLQRYLAKEKPGLPRRLPRH